MEKNLIPNALNQVINEVNRIVEVEKQSELTQLKAENERLKGDIKKLNETYKGFNLDMGICLKMLSDRRLSSTMKSLLEDLKNKQRNRLFIVKGITNP